MDVIFDAPKSIAELTLTVTVTTDAMDDGSKNGIRYNDTATVEEVDRAHWGELKYRLGVYLVKVGELVFLRQILLIGANEIKCLSWNQNHADFTVDLAKVKKIYRILSFGEHTNCGTCYYKRCFAK